MLAEQKKKCHIMRLCLDIFILINILVNPEHVTISNRTVKRDQILLFINNLKTVIGCKQPYNVIYILFILKHVNISNFNIKVYSLHCKNE